MIYGDGRLYPTPTLCIHGVPAGAPAHDAMVGRLSGGVKGHSLMHNLQQPLTVDALLKKLEVVLSVRFFQGADHRPIDQGGA